MPRITNKSEMVVALTYLYAAWLVVQIFLAKFGLDAFSKTLFLDAIAATAHRPYVYRALVPAIIRTVVDYLPGSLSQQVVAMLNQPEIVPPHATTFSPQYAIFALLAWACFVGFAYCMRWLTRHFYSGYSSRVVDFGVPLVSLLALPLFFRHFNFVYDPATIVLFPLTLICLLRERYVLYTLVLVLCALNKETAVLLIVAYLVHARTRGTRLLPTVGFAILQLVVCLGIYKYITYSMADRPGVPMEIQLFKYNLRLPIGQPYAFLWLVWVAGSFIYFVSRDWKTKPAFLRLTLVCMLIPHTAMLLVVGCLDEIRVFYEVYAIAALLMVPTVIATVRTCLGESEDTPAQ